MIPDQITARRLRDEGHPASKILLVGELNPYGGPDSNALVPWPERCAGHRLQSSILGIDEETYLAMHRRNLCRAVWSAKAARFSASETMTTGVWPWTTIIALGRKVAAAYVKGLEPFECQGIFGHVEDGDFATHVQEFLVIALPHPSGRNVLWNRRENIDRARDLLRARVPGVPWGSLVP